MADTKIYSGNSKINGFYLGNAEANEVYLGNELIYQKLSDGEVYTDDVYTYTYSQALDGWNVQVTNPDSTTPITQAPLVSIKGKHLKGMNSTFAGCQATSIDLSSFDTSNITRMIGMFADCQATSLDLSSFNVSNTTNMQNMFSRCQATTGFAKDQATCNKFNKASVTNIPSTFYFVVKR